jgi:hypothetical protein
VAVIALLLAACSLGAGGGTDATPTEGTSLLPDEPHLERQSLEALFAAAGTFLQTSGDLQLISFRCTIIEGTFCWFGERTQDGGVASELARSVVDQIGPGAIENAKQNEVAIQCYRPLGDGEPYCEIDWGWGAGYEPLTIS